MGMAAALLPDPLWDLVEPFLPTPPHRPNGGRPRVSDRACLGICLSSAAAFPGKLRRKGGRSDRLSRAVVDSCSIRAVHGGDQTGPNPTDRAKRGSKRHLICDGRGVPLAVAAQDVEGRLKPMPAFPALVRQKAVLLWKSRPYGCLAAFRGAGHGNRSTLRRICVSVRRSTSASLRGHQHGHAEDDRALILVRDVSQVPLRVDKEAERLAGETPHDADLKTQRQ